MPTLKAECADDVRRSAKAKAKAQAKTKARAKAASKSMHIVKPAKRAGRKLGQKPSAKKLATDAAKAEAHLTRLEAYKREHGDCNVPASWPEDPKLANFVHMNRGKKKALDARGEDHGGGLTVALVAKLDAIGFAWKLPAAARKKQRSEARWDDAGWERRLAVLQRYEREHGDANVPAQWAEDPRLANWVTSQRVAKKALDRGDPWPQITAARVARLEALGFEWKMSAGSGRVAPRLDDARWEAQLAKLEEYKRRHGDCCVKKSLDKKLGTWVHTQRTNKKSLDRGEPGHGMTAARAAKLDAISFAWAQPGTGE